MDSRVQKLAQVLVAYSLDLQPGETLAVKTNPLADELNLAVYQEALLAGAHVTFLNQIPGMWEVYYRYAGLAELDHVSEFERIVHEQFSAILDIEAEYNTRELTEVDPARITRRRSARRDLFRTMLERMANGDLKWCGTLFPTPASAQEANMGLIDYQEFVYKAGMLDSPDPVMAWKEKDAKQKSIIDLLMAKESLVLRGKDIDLRLSIKGRVFNSAAGRTNFPDGEIFTSPVEESASGWIRFAYPAIYSSREVDNVELWFQDGKIVKEKATKGEEFLREVLNTDPGARYLGELGIGTNYAIQRFTKNMLFDEKLGGTIHLAVGIGFPELGSQNHSAIHWDLLCDMADGEILADGETIYQNGKFILGS